MQFDPIRAERTFTVGCPHVHLHLFGVAVDDRPDVVEQTKHPEDSTLGGVSSDPADLRPVGFIEPVVPIVHLEQVDRGLAARRVRDDIERVVDGALESMLKDHIDEDLRSDGSDL
jgi:hypothetical protein